MQGSISVSVRVAPWVPRYLEMVRARALRTQQLPLMDVVGRVCMRGVTAVVR